MQLNTMTKEKLQEKLGSLFETQKRGEDDIIVFNSEAFDKASELNPLYEAVSGAMHDSGLSHEFSYQIGSRAIDILTELEDWEDGDTLREQVDSSIPVYNWELMQIYSNDWWAVDEARKSFGESGDSVKDAQMAWYEQLTQMTETIAEKLKSLVDEEPAK